MCLGFGGGTTAPTRRSDFLYTLIDYLKRKFGFEDIYGFIDFIQMNKETFKDVKVFSFSSNSFYTFFKVACLSAGYDYHFLTTHGFRSG